MIRVPARIGDRRAVRDQSGKNFRQYDAQRENVVARVRRFDRGPGMAVAVQFCIIIVRQRQVRKQRLPGIVDQNVIRGQRAMRQRLSMQRR